MLDHLIAAQPDHQCAVAVHPQLLGALKPDVDRPRIGPRRHHEIVFQQLLIAVVHQVDAGINSRILHRAIGRDVGAPLAGIVADEIVALAGQRVGPGHTGMRIGASQFHAKHGVRLLAVE